MRGLSVPEHIDLNQFESVNGLPVWYFAASFTNCRTRLDARKFVLSVPSDRFLSGRSQKAAFLRDDG